MAKKSWAEKRDSGRPFEVKTLEKDGPGMKAGQRLLITNAKIVDDMIRAIPEGETLDPTEMRAALAEKYGAELCCPLTSGIHLRIVAEAAFEAYEKSGSLEGITPFWRVIGKKTPTFKKLSFDTDFVVTQRQREGLEP